MASSTARAEGRSHPASRFLPGPRPRVIAHRGFALDGAENTLRAFEDALAAGADMLETDTRASADGTAYAVHDEDLLRIAGDRRRIARSRDRELAAVRVGGSEPLALLEDVLGSFPQVPINLDVKDERAVAPAVTAIARTGAASRVCVTSFSGTVAERAVHGVRAATGITPLRSPSQGALAAFRALVALGAPTGLVGRVLRPYAALQIPREFRGIPLLTPETIATAHRHGCEVHVWTIDDRTAMEDLVTAGVDGIITNRTDLLVATLRAHGRDRRREPGHGARPAT